MYLGQPPSSATATAKATPRGASLMLRRWLFRRGKAPMPPIAAITAAVMAAEATRPLAPAPAETEESLARLIDEAEAALSAVSGLIVRSGTEARDYGDALESHAGAMAAAPDDTMVAALTGLTRAMIERTRTAEARMAAMGAEMALLQSSLADARDEAGRDALTGLPNRRALAERLAVLVAATRTAGAALSVAFCDVDHFKAINDTHGHDVGDRVLRLVAETLAGAADADCMVGRHGGEEFLMLFDGADADEAAARVDAVRETLAARNLRVRQTEASIGRVTFSAGVASLRADRGEEDMLARADAALYRAKQGGRNRVERDGAGSG